MKTLEIGGGRLALVIYKLYNTIDNFNLFSVEALKAEVRSAASEETAGDDPDAGAGGGSGRCTPKAAPCRRR